MANNFVSGPDCMKIWPLGSIPKNIKIVVWDWSHSLNVEPWDWSHRLDFNRRDRSRLYIGTWFYDLKRIQKFFRNKTILRFRSLFVAVSLHSIVWVTFFLGQILVGTLEKSLEPFIAMQLRLNSQFHMKTAQLCSIFCKTLEIKVLGDQNNLYIIYFQRYLSEDSELVF